MTPRIVLSSLLLTSLAFGCDEEEPPLDMGTEDMAVQDTAVQDTSEADTSEADMAEADTREEPTHLCDYPSGPYGASVSYPFEPFTLNDCDGNPYDFINEEFCSDEHTLTVLSIAAGWCGPCQEESSMLTEQITERYADRGVRVIQLLIQDENFREPTAAFCDNWVNTFGLTNVELLDPVQISNVFFPDGALPATILVDRNGIIRHRETAVSPELLTLRNHIEEILADFE